MENPEEEKFISLCIPSYNRPYELKRLLESIDCRETGGIEVVICEDKSPLREDIREVVNDYNSDALYQVKYIENVENLGYDKNLKELILNSTGKYIIYMGDDDEFVEGALDKYIKFLKENDELGYVLKTSRLIHQNESIEEFRYYNRTTYFEKGIEAYVSLFRKSVFISGFTFKRVLSTPYLTDKFDGTLLFQLYILAEITLRHKSAYCDILLTQQHEEGIPYFGSSDNEKDLYTPGSITITNSINFMKGYFKITNYIDEVYNVNSTQRVAMDISKYSYPILSIQRNKGIKEFISYYRKLNELGINKSKYYYIYYYGLLIMGKNNCDQMIQLIKRIMKRTPAL